MTDVVNLAERRWDADNDTRSHSIVDMLRIAIDRLERGDIEGDHAILLLGTANAETNGNGMDWLQAGKFDFYQQVGMLERMKISMCNGAEEL